MKASTVLLLGILTSVSGPASFDKNPWTPVVVAGFSAASLAGQDGPAPTPKGDECENCNGTGKVGDGRTMLTCTVCDGTGKVKKETPVPAVVPPPEKKAEPEPKPESPKAPVKSVTKPVAKGSSVVEEDCAVGQT